MSKNGKLIFKDFDPYVTSPFGYRIHPLKGGMQFHAGVDYGTNGKKLPQYALEDGYVTGCGKDSTGALFVYVKYPRLGKTAIHYHLDSYKVANNQKVNANTIIGYTGTTGNSTGIHLHFGWFPTEDRYKAWDKKRWEDFEAYEFPKVDEKKERIKTLQATLNKQYKAGLVVDGIFGVKTSAVCKKNYLYQGKKATTHIRWLQTRLIELGYDLGKYGADGSFGNDTLNAVKKFQSDRKIEVDGYVGVETHKKLVE